jgi:hypothetical protein
VDAQVTPEQLALNVGEELADKLTQMEWTSRSMEDVNGRTHPQDHKVLSGVGLEVGGAGMKGFYDKMIPSFADKIGKKWGVKTEDVTLSGDHTVHSLPLTEAMRKDILDNGQALYMPSPVAQKHLEQFNGDTVKQAMKKPGWAILTATQEAVDKGDPFSPANVAANDALAASLQGSQRKLRRERSGKELPRHGHLGKGCDGPRERVQAGQYFEQPGFCLLRRRERIPD